MRPSSSFPCLLPCGLALLFLAASCTHNSDELTLTRYYEDGRAKPIVAIPTMIDTTSFDASWNIAEELTESIVQSIGTEGNIYLHAQESFSIADNPFGKDLAWMKREFENQEFAVFLELVEHEMLPAKKTKSLDLRETASNLSMGVRIRIIDLRGPKEKIVLQELIRDTYYIPKSLIPTDYQVVCWGTEDYAQSPMGIAHSRIVQEIASRISDYVLLAKSR